MAIVVGTNSWVTEAIANTYLGDRLDADGYWVDGAENNPRALITAYRWLNAGKYSFPDTATQVMKDAQCEYALFLLEHQPDLDLRMGLQVQGVITAGVVKERYKFDNFVELPIPPIVQSLLAAYDTDRPIYMVDIERNEEETVTYDAHANLVNDEAND